MVKETHFLISLLQKRKRDYPYESIPLISILLLLLEGGIQIDLWLIFVVSIVSALKISFGEVVNQNVKRDPKIGQRSIRQYKKSILSLKKNFGKDPKEFFKFGEIIPLPKRMGIIYLVIIGLFLATYVYVMHITLSQLTPMTSALFLVQLTLISLVYFKVFTQLFGKL